VSASRRRPVWTQAHVRRLFWRAGFGATPAEARRFARAGRAATLKWVLDGPRHPRLRGRVPTVDGSPLDPVNEYGHDVLWWLDWMVRSQRPLVEKLTLFWHDHFATSDQDTPLMLGQNHALRRHSLGRFRALLGAITVDPAMQLFLSLADSDKEAPNENFARELMELFTLGGGYTERDIREAARALTGYVANWSDSSFEGITFDRERHDGGVKRIFGKRGRFGPADVLDLVCAHPRHAHFMVRKLWDFFIVDPPSRATLRDLARTYRRSGLRIKPVVSEILSHRALYRRLGEPTMVKAPVVYVAGALRTTGTPITTSDPVWLLSEMGQRLFDPPSVAGWDWGPAWMSSNSMRVRFSFGNFMLEHSRAAVAEGSVQPRSPAKALALARAATGAPAVSRPSAAELRRMAARFFDDIEPKARDDRRRERAEMLQRALRHHLISGPDAQLH
jgi:uncharacterized protein (DUF1800 family)